MKHRIKLPRLADTVDDYVLVDWMVDVGAAIVAGDPLVRVETDKTEVEVPSPVTGTVVGRVGESGDDVSTGQVICEIESD